MAQSHHGWSPISADSIGTHDVTVIPDVPTTDWSTFFKPWDVPMLTLDVEHGFALRWWMMSLILLLGAYVLLLALTDRTAIAVLFSLALWLSPFFQWWYVPSSLDTVGMGMLSVGAFLYSLRASSAPRRVAWLALAAYSAIGFGLLFYPPFQIPTALVLGVVGACYVVGHWGELGVTTRKLIIDLAALAIVIGGTLGAFYLHSRSTIVAIDGTVYPGHRRVSGGGTSLLQLLSAPFGLTLARHGTSLPAALNQSEISSFVFLGPFALLQMQRVRLKEFARRWRLLLVGTAAVFITITAWYLISLPPVLASLLLLSRVEARRAILGVGLGGILLMAIFCAAEFDKEPPGQSSADHRPRAWDDRQQRIVTGAVACGGLAFGMYFWAGRSLRQFAPGLGLSLWKAGAMSLAAAVVVFLISARKVIWGGLALVLLGAVISVPVNPLYQGLGPLMSSPILSTFTRVASKPPDSAHRAWLSFGLSNLNPVLVASGLETLSAPSFYPNAKAWGILGPKHANVWNRYAGLLFVPAPRGAPPDLEVIGSLKAAVQITIDPCGSAAGRLGVGFVVSASPLTYSCLRLDTKTTFEGTPTYIYNRSAMSS
ncbi:MAG TPA: hypothetical protein VK283_12235 [Acidimicrobiales bacterium]|nr:hypothetical protein [Acidimicrobiales bacterium]